MRWLLTLLLISSCVRAQPAGIQGTAVDAATHQPMAGVHIVIKPLSSDQLDEEDTQAYGAISRQDGRFSIVNLKPGPFTPSMPRITVISIYPRKRPATISPSRSSRAI